MVFRAGVERDELARRYELVKKPYRPVLKSLDVVGAVSGTTNQVNVTDDGDGTVTLGTPQDIHTGASPTFGGLAKVGGASDYVEVASTGDVLFTGGSGLAFANIFVKDSVATVNVDSDDPDTLITQWTTDGESNNCTSDAANDKITFTKTGKYMVTGHFTVDLNSGATVVLRIDGYLNGVAQTVLHASRTVSATGIGSMSLNGIIDVTTVGWDLDVRANIDSATARDLTVSDAQLTVVQIGGT